MNILVAFGYSTEKTNDDIPTFMVRTGAMLWSLLTRANWTANSLKFKKIDCSVKSTIDLLYFLWIMVWVEELAGVLL